MTISDSGGYIALPPNPESSSTVNHEDGDFNATDSINDPLLSPQSTRARGSVTFHPDSDTYTYSYGPKGLSGLWNNYYALLCAFFASIGGLTFGYDQGVIANVLVMYDFQQRWPVTPLQKGIMTVLELGALFGALAAGTLADRYSRRHSIFFACLIFCIGSAFQCGAQTLNHLFIGRAVGGIGVGALSMLSPLYMAEISPPEVRGSLMALEQFSIVLGVVVGFWTGFVTRSIPSSASWRIPLGVQIVPGVVLGLGCFFLPPSPRLLVLHGRHEDALQSLARLRQRPLSDISLQIELLEMKVETRLIQQTITGGESTDTDKREPWTLRAELRGWKRLFGQKYRDRTMVGVFIMVFQQWSGINALLYYGPTVIRSIGMQGDTVTLIVSGGIGIVQFLAVMPAIVFIDQLGRKPLLRGGSLIMTFSHLSIALLVYNFEGNWLAHSTAAWTAVGAIYIFTAAYGVSLGPIGWVLPSEVFPLSMRGKGVALSTASAWFNNFLIGLITPVLVEYSSVTTFMTFSIACFLAYFWATYLVPETANVSLEEIDAVFRSSAGGEDAALKRQIEVELGLMDLVHELGTVGSGIDDI